MPNREFLEKFPLYRKFKMELPERLPDLKQPAIFMPCLICGSSQTFNMSNGYYGYPTKGAVIEVEYQCAACHKFQYHFFLKFDPEGKFIAKVGQEPPWDITPDRALEKILGERAEYYKRGLICESQSYGIGAFAYYRRVVEEIIDDLLTRITDLMSGEDKGLYMQALEKVKATTITQEKIEIVKDLLPPILRPDGMNPLSTLHGVLSEGLHSETDERCIELAMTIREVLVFLVNQVAVTSKAANTFTERMRKLLERHEK